MERLITFTPSVPPKPEIDYPESDGEPMGETQFHVRAILFLYQALEYFFRANDEMYVSADMLFYYEEGNRSAFKVPDVFVVRGVSKHTRRIYKLWEEQVAPCAVFEITSRGTWLQDMGDKRTLYEKLGVAEYFMFDPEGEYLTPRLQGFRLVAGVYQPMSLTADGSLYSQSLDVILKPQNEFLRVIDPQTSELVPNLFESNEQMEFARKLAETEAERAETEAERAEAEAKRAEAEAKRAEVEAKRAELEAKRAEAEAERAEVEAERAEVEAERAEVEAERADTAEAEIARLQAELERLRHQSDQDS